MPTGEISGISDRPVRTKSGATIYDQTSTTHGPTPTIRDPAPTTRDTAPNIPDPTLNTPADPITQTPISISPSEITKTASTVFMVTSDATMTNSPIPEVPIQTNTADTATNEKTIDISAIVIITIIIILAGSVTLIVLKKFFWRRDKSTNSMSFIEYQPDSVVRINVRGTDFITETPRSSHYYSRQSSIVSHDQPQKPPTVLYRMNLSPHDADPAMSSQLTSPTVINE